ncbi:hypothetical protein JCM11641_001576 [Rhodosporidiobolus odoratus]
MSDSAAASRPSKAKRTYRACAPCRARKLKCDLGDPDNPSDPPCKRCRRETRDCVFVARANAKSYLDSTPAAGVATAPYSSVAPQRPKPRKTAHSVSHDVDVAAGPSAARAAAHPYAPSTTAGWGPSPSSSSNGKRATTPGQDPTNASQVGYYYPPAHAVPPCSYDPDFPYIPSIPQHPIASTSQAECPPPLPSRESPHSAGSDGEEDDLDRSFDEDEDEPMGSPSTSSRGGGGAAGASNADVLLSSQLHNPSDALRLLATASSLRSLAAQDHADSHSPHEGAGLASSLSSASGIGMSVGGATSAEVGAGEIEGQSRGRRRSREREQCPDAQGNRSAGWERWVPIQEEMVGVAEAEVLLSFFQEHMSPLYPLLIPRIFSASHLPQLTSRESLLLASMITISARYSSLPSASRARAIHQAVADYIRDELIGLLDGSGELRHISSVEALLLLTEWPPIADGRAKWGRSGNARGRKTSAWGSKNAGGTGENGAHGEVNEEEERAEDAEALLSFSVQYDGMSWSLIGCAVRLAQELGIHNLNFGNDRPVTWQEERCLRTWIYCFNADRHVSVRLGRNAVVQAYMSSSWWEQVTFRASREVRGEGLSEVWAQRFLPQGLIAALVGTIQERLYPNKDITRSLLKSGEWETFIRSLDHELRMMLLKSRVVLQAGNIEATLLQMEFDYVRLYGNAIALRALQERLRRAVKAQDLWFVSPSLLNLQEGQWVLDALAAAQSILDKTVNYLAPKGFLKVAPSRIFLRILFACTFLFKALAVGVVEHGQSKVMGLLEECISNLHTHAVDRQHIARGFAALLRRLQAQCKPTLLSRFGVRPVQPIGAEQAGTPIASNVGTPAPQHAPSPHPHPHPPQHPPPVATDSKAAFASTPAASQPDTISVAPRLGMPPLPPTHDHPIPGSFASPSLPSGYPPSLPYYPSAHAFPPSLASAAAYGGPYQHWYGGDSSHDVGGFKLADVPAGFDLSNPFDWDPTASNIAVGKEQDLLFQSLWGGAGAMGGSGEVGDGGVNPALGLFGTLVGDEFGSE